MKFYLFLFLFSLLIANDLKPWIEEKSKLIQSNNYSIKFAYKIKDNRNIVKLGSYKVIEYYSINKDSSIIKIDDKVTFCSKNYWETVDLNTKQIFLQNVDDNFEDLKYKFLLVFNKGGYKIISFKKNKYLLSMDDYFTNIIINYETQSDSLLQFDINEANHKLHIKDFSIEDLDFQPFNSLDLKNFTKFDIR